MSNFGKGIPLASGFDLGAKAPLDSRITVQNIQERDAHVLNNRAYEGLKVYVIDENCEYLWDGNTWLLIPSKQYVDDAISNIQIDEELSDYQTKVDDTLETYSKEVVGAINELKENSIEAEDYIGQDLMLDGDVESRISNLEATRATYQYVDTQIANAGLENGATIDLSNYVTLDTLRLQINTHNHPTIDKSEINTIIEDLF